MKRDRDYISTLVDLDVSDLLDEIFEGKSDPEILEMISGYLTEPAKPNVDIKPVRQTARAVYLSSLDGERLQDAIRLEDKDTCMELLRGRSVKRVEPPAITTTIAMRAAMRTDPRFSSKLAALISQAPA